MPLFLYCFVLTLFLTFNLVLATPLARRGIIDLDGNGVPDWCVDNGDGSANCIEHGSWTRIVTATSRTTSRSISTQKTPIPPTTIRTTTTIKTLPTTTPSKTTTTTRSISVPSTTTRTVATTTKTTAKATTTSTTTPIKSSSTATTTKPTTPGSTTRTSSSSSSTSIKSSQTLTQMMGSTATSNSVRNTTPVTSSLSTSSFRTSAMSSITVTTAASPFSNTTPSLPSSTTTKSSTAAMSSSATDRSSVSSPSTPTTGSTRNATSSMTSLTTAIATTTSSTTTTSASSNTSVVVTSTTVAGTSLSSAPGSTSSTLLSTSSLSTTSTATFTNSTLTSTTSGSTTWANLTTTFATTITTTSTTTTTTTTTTSLRGLPAPSTFAADKGRKWNITMVGNLGYTDRLANMSLNGDKCRTGMVAGRIMWNCGDMQCGQSWTNCGFDMGPAFWATDSVMIVNTDGITNLGTNTFVTPWSGDPTPQSNGFTDWGMDTSNVVPLDDTRSVVYAWEIWRSVDGSISDRGNAVAIVTAGATKPIATRMGPLLTGPDAVQLGLVAILRDGSYVYIYSYSANVPSRLVVTRVPATVDAVLDASKYEALVYGSNSTWTPGIPKQSDSTHGMMTDNGIFGCAVYGSVFYNTYLKKYLIVCNIFMWWTNMYTSDTPWGPWSAEYQLLPGVIQGYGSHAHPEYGNGKDFYFSQGPGGVFNMFKVSLGGYSAA